MRLLTTLLLLALLPAMISCEGNLPEWGLNHGDLDILQVSSTLSDLETDPVRGFIYAADWTDNLVHFIDTQKDRISVSLPIGSKPINLEMDPRHDDLYVALEGADAVAVVDPDQLAILRTLSLPFAPRYMAISGDNRVFVGPLDPSDGTTIAVDALTGEILHDFTGGGFSSRPVGEIVAIGDSVVVIARSQYLYKFDITDRNAATLQFPAVEIDELDLSGRQMEASSDGSLIYVSGRQTATFVEVFRTLDLVKVGEMDTELPSVYVTLSPDGSQAYVASSMQMEAQSNTAATYVTGFSTNTYARTDRQLSLGDMSSTSLAFSPDGRKLYVIVSNPYRITDNPYGDLRQDLQILHLR